MQTQRTYQVQHWPNGQWSLEHNWKKVEAASAKEAAEKVCGRALKQDGKLAQRTIKTYPNVSQFWSFDEKWFREQPVYSRDYPPLKS